MKRLVFGLATLLGVLTTTLAGASPITFTSEAAFTAAAVDAGIALTTETFATTPFQGVDIVVDDLKITGFGAVVENLFFGDGIGVTNTWTDLSFQFFSPVNAFAVSIFGLSGFGVPTTFSYGVNGVSGDLVTNFTGPQGNELFVGFIDTDPIFTVSFRNTLEDDYVEFDDLRYGAGPAAVPEPTSMLLLATGLIAVGIRRYRHRRTRQ